ncbi:MAG: universal stress protein [Hyphomicrobiales bacterium]
MKKILIPVDFSEHSITTCKFALKLFKGHDTEITLFHTYFDQLTLAENHLTTDLEPNIIGFMDERIFKDLKKNSEKKLDELAENLNNYKNILGNTSITILTKTEGGLPLNEVLNSIKREHYDYLFLGSKKDHEKRIGDNSLQYKLLNRSSIPVFVVPPEVDNTEIKNILYLTELNLVDIDHIHGLYKFYKSDSLRINILHFEKSNKENTYEKMTSFKSSFSQSETNNALDFMIEPAVKVEEKLEELTKSLSIDLISFIPQKKTMSHIFSVPAVSKKDLLHLNIPLLAIPEKAIYMNE